MSNHFFINKLLKIIVLILLISSPLIYIGLFVINAPGQLLNIPETVQSSFHDLNVLEQVIIFFLPLITPIIYWLAFYQLYWICYRYEQINGFDSHIIHSIRRFGLLLIMTDIASVFQSLLTSLIISWLELTEFYLRVDLMIGMSVVGLFIIFISEALNHPIESKITL